MNIRTFITLMAAVLLASQPVCAQYNNRLFDIDSTVDFGLNIRINTDGSLLVFGNANNQNGINMGTLVLSSNGQTQLQKHFITKPSVSYGNPNYGVMKKNSLGQYVYPISIAYPSSPLNHYTLNASLMKLNSLGDTISIKSYTDTSLSNENLKDLAIAKDGDVVLGGYQRNPNYYAIVQGMMIRTDSNGNLKWRQLYQRPAYATQHQLVNSVQSLPDGRILVCMSVTDHVPGLYDYYRAIPWVFITDSAGNILKERFFPTKYGGASAFPAVYVDANGGYFLRNTLDTVVTTDQFNGGFFPPYLAHLDTNFNITWIRTFADTFGIYGILTAKQLVNKDYLIVGERGVDTSPAFVGWAARINPQGNIIWQHTYSNDTNYDAAISDVAERSNGSLVMVGKGQNGNNPSWHQTDMWVLGTDANGCATAGCSTTGIEDVDLNETSLKVYPNPTSGAITIESAEDGSLTFSNVQGQQVAQMPIQKGKMTAQIPATLPAGIYMGKFTGKETGNNLVIRLVYNP